SPPSRVAIGAHGSSLLRNAFRSFSWEYGLSCFLVWEPVAALVLGALMTLLLNPTMLQLGGLLLFAIAAFVVGALVIRYVRKNLAEETDSLASQPLSVEGLPVHSFHAVIQQLKQQKHELSAQQAAERRKAKASDSLSATLLANLSCGVLFFNTN